MSANGSNHRGAEDAFRGEMRSAPAETELAALGDKVRRAYVHDPPADVAERHIAAILAEADRVAAGAPVDVGRAPAPSRRRVPLLRLAALAGATFAVTGGLAVAGVRPPEPFSDLYEAVGFDVPGSDDDGGTAGDQGGEKRDDDSKTAGRNGDGGGSSASARVGDPSGGEASSDQSAKPGERTGQQAGHASEEGQKTADDARSGNTPPSDPGRSESHPEPQGTGPQGAGPPAQGDGGPPPHAQGTPPSRSSLDPPGHSGEPKERGPRLPTTPLGDLLDPPGNGGGKPDPKPR
jgi:hypothetical protein